MSFVYKNLKKNHNDMAAFYTFARDLEALYNEKDRIREEEARRQGKKKSSHDLQALLRAEAKKDRLRPRSRREGLSGYYD